MLKSKPYKLIKLQRQSCMLFGFDHLLTNNGHSVLSLPPFHPDLYPIEMMLRIEKHRVGKNNVTFNMYDVIRLCEEKFAPITKEGWVPICEKVKKLEEDYYAKEWIMGEVTYFLLHVDLFLIFDFCYICFLRTVFSISDL